MNPEAFVYDKTLDFCVADSHNAPPFADNNDEDK